VLASGLPHENCVLLSVFLTAYLTAPHVTGTVQTAQYCVLICTAVNVLLDLREQVEAVGRLFLALPSPEPATDSLLIFSQMGAAHNFLFRYFKIYFNIMLPSTCRSSLQVLQSNWCTHVIDQSRACCMSRPSHPPDCLSLTTGYVLLSYLLKVKV